MRSLLIFSAIQFMAFTFGLSNVETIAFIVVGIAAVIFSTAYFAAAIKDRRNKRASTINTAFEVQ
jgi:uncharacterized membrane protein YuzA (DUF378 family)